MAPAPPKAIAVVTLQNVPSTNLYLLPHGEGVWKEETPDSELPPSNTEHFF
jgi:hypothetical protein